MGTECEECGSRFTSGKLLAHHRLICGIQQSPPTKKRKTGSQVGRGHRAAFQEHAAIESFTPTHDHDILAALKELEPDITQYLKERRNKDPIKWYVNMHCVFKKLRQGEMDVYDFEDIYQASKTYTAILPEDIEEVIPEVFQTISALFQEFQREGSGWTLDHVVKIEKEKDLTVGRSFTGKTQETPCAIHHLR